MASRSVEEDCPSNAITMLFLNFCSIESVFFPISYRLRPRYDWYDDDYEERRYPTSHRDRYDDYDRSRSPGYDYDQRYNRFGRYDLRPLYYYYDRYQIQIIIDNIYIPLCLFCMHFCVFVSRRLFIRLCGNLQPL